MPEWMEYPVVTVGVGEEKWHEPLTFLCQLRMEEVAPYDPQGLLPHVGMLWFFAALDYYLGDLDAEVYPGLGLWTPEMTRVLYSNSCEGLRTHKVVNSDGSPAELPAERVAFAPCGRREEGLKLLGEAYVDEVEETLPGCVSLLQVEEEERWGLQFHDCGVLNFVIGRKALADGRWEEVRGHLFSY